MPNPENKPIIAVDIDDVLVPHAQKLIDWYNQEYGTKLTLSHHHTKDPKPWGTQSVEEAIRRVRNYVNSGVLFKHQPVTESIEALKKLSEDYGLVIITGRDLIIEAGTRDWIKKHYPGLFESVHFSALYSLEGKARSKVEICKMTNASYLIDDSLDQALEVPQIGTTVLLFGDYPWNETDKPLPGVVRVANWQEVVEYFDGRG
jgi:uncharacterized HAD superfamily protein